MCVGGGGQGVSVGGGEGKECVWGGARNALPHIELISPNIAQCDLIRTSFPAGGSARDLGFGPEKPSDEPGPANVGSKIKVTSGTGSMLSMFQSGSTMSTMMESGFQMMAGWASRLLTLPDPLVTSGPHQGQQAAAATVGRGERAAAYGRGRMVSTAA